MELTKNSISPLILRIAFPIMIGLFFDTMYNVVDAYFAGQLSVNAVSALTISFPLFFILFAISIGLADGSGAIIANYLGAKDERKANFYFRQTISLSIIFSLILYLFWALFDDHLLSILKVNEKDIPYVKDYINPLYLFAPFMVLTNVLNVVFESRGITKYYRNILIFTFFLNIALNYLLIYGYKIYGTTIIPEYGFKGISYSTVIANLCVFAYLLWKIKKHNFLESIKINQFFPDIKAYTSILKQTLPSILTLFGALFFFFIVIYYVNSFGAESTAAFGIALRIEHIFFVPIFGVTSAVAVLTAQNLGAKKIERIRKTRKLGIIFCIVILSIGIIAILLFSKELISIFSNNAKIIEEGSTYLKIQCALLLSTAFIFVNVSVLQGLKKPHIGLYITFLRNVLLPFIALYIIQKYYDYVIYDLWWAMVYISWISALLYTIFTNIEINKIEKNIYKTLKK